MDLLAHYFVAVEKAVYAASNGCNATEELALLAPLQSELRSAFDNLILRPDPIAAAATHSINAAEKREQEQFMLGWRSGGEVEYLTGWQALIKKLRLSENSLRVYLSKGKGTFSLNRCNPITLERDQLVVVRAAPSAQPVKQRGRPSKQVWTDRLGDPENR